MSKRYSGHKHPITRVWNSASIKLGNEGLAYCIPITRRPNEHSIKKFRNCRTNETFVRMVLEWDGVNALRHSPQTHDLGWDPSALGVIHQAMTFE